MGYQRNYWSDGDIITAEKMNNLEEAVAAGSSGESGSNFYDGYIKLYHGSGSDAEWEIEILYGNFAAIKEKLDNDLCPNILVSYVNRQVHRIANSNAISIYSHEEDSIAFIVQLPYQSNVSGSQFTTEFFSWTIDDEIIF